MTRPFAASSRNLSLRALLLVAPGLLAAACAAGDDGDSDPLPAFGAGGTGAQPNGSPNASAGTSGLPSGVGGSTPGAGGSAQNPLPGAGSGGTGSVSTGSGGTGAVAGGGTGGTPGSGGTGNTTGAGGTANGAGGTANQPPPEPLPNGFYLIDDFEGGRDPQWTESKIGGTGSTFTIDTTQGANGSTSSLRIDANGVFHTMLQFALPQTVRDANEVFGRVFLRLAQTPGSGHFIWVEVGNTTNDQHEMRLGHNVGRLQSNHFFNGGEQDIRDQNRQLAANQWYCLEFFMDNNPEQLRVWLDGEETALSTTNYTAGAGAEGNGTALPDFIPPLEAFRIGWELQDGTVFFDDVALAAQRIGCDP
jgi:hypothetical protein